METLDWPEAIKESQRHWIGKSEGAEIDFVVKGLNTKITVFTTRPDTLYGVTYIVLAPEHHLVQDLLSQIKNKDVVEGYIEAIRIKPEIERTAEGKEKSGVALDGISVIHPLTKQEIPIWIADYVLTDYGTGAVMAVPAHDERDYEFAKKYNLPVVDVIIPRTIDKKIPHAMIKKLLLETMFTP